MYQKRKKRNDLVEIVTPKGIAIHPWLHKPDTKFEATGVFKVTLRLPADEATDLVQKIREVVKVKYAEAKEINAKNEANGKKSKEIKVAKPFHPVVGEDQEETGELDFVFKMKHIITLDDGSTREMRPVILDSHKNELNPVPEIRYGSVLRVNAHIDPYLQNMDQIKVGATLRLRAVQVIELAQAPGSNRSASSFGFEAEEEGFVGNQLPGNMDKMNPIHEANFEEIGIEF
jgi:hypothetical protein